MLQRNIYYSIKPLIPLRLRRAIRGHFVRRQLRRVAGVWPILETAGKTPSGWAGWPDRKQFAVVLTHDVEGPEGVSKVRQLAELEMKLGFRSSFNFIPEGPYRVPAELRQWLVGHGFEVGVHDLHHDGKLYRSRKGFLESSERINRYLKEWGAVGYRSGFMLHNFPWHHELDVLYDATSFDNDPFEPQPDGVGTIFPFFVPPPACGSEEPSLRQKKSGYVELPYTLAQDSTLFLLLGETTPRIWMEKLAWIARKGGMALMNTHPDYMDFRDGKPSSHCFDVGMYEEFLRHVATDYAGRYWHDLPRAVAQFAREHGPHRPLQKSRRVCMISYSEYESDNRVRRYAEALQRRGDEVEVLSTKTSVSESRNRHLHGVWVSRLTLKQSLKSSVLSYFLRVARFYGAAAITLSWRAFLNRYDLVHVHNMPDFLVFAAWLPKLRGARIILDLHDLVPELFADKLGGGNTLPARTLRREERASAAFAHHVIISNHLWVREVTARSAPLHKCSVFINNIDLDLFHRRARTRQDDRKILLFHGSLSRHQGVDLVIQAMPAIRSRVPSAEFHVYGSGSNQAQLQALVDQNGLTSAVKFHPPVLLEEIPEIIANADVGVVAKRADSFGNRAFSTKTYEFMSQGVPVVLSETEVDRFYFDDSVAAFFESGNVPALADAVTRVLLDDEFRRRQVSNADELVAENAWQTRCADYLALVDSLIENRPLPADRMTYPRIRADRVVVADPVASS